MRIIIFLSLLFCFQSTKAQKTSAIYGTVKLNGEPVAGIPIRLRNEGITTVTDTKGWFRFASSTPYDTILVVSTAYEHLVFPISLNETMPLTLNLQPVTKAMDAVVVNTGYQTIPKERATGSFTTISKDLFNQQVGTTVLSRLESITNGLYVDRSTPSNPKIVIRGISTIRGPRSPLIILNNFPYAGNLDDINPNEVESITILKDAAAASIWGTQAGNGVIVITTKKALFNQRIRGTFSSNIIITEKPDLDNIKAFSPSDNIELERFLFDKNYYNSILNNTPWIGVSPVIALLQKQKKGLITKDAADAAIALLGQHDVRSDYRGDVYSTGTNLQQALSLYGGSNNLGWTVSGGWDKNIGSLDDKYDRYNLRTTQLYKITSKLQLTTGIDYTLSTSKTGKIGYPTQRAGNSFLPMYTSLIDDNGKALAIPYFYNKEYTDTVYKGKLQDWGYYPLTDWTHNTTVNTLQAVIADLGANYALSSWITFSGKYQYTRQSNGIKFFHDAQSYFARDAINAFSQRNPGTGNLIYHVPLGGVMDQSDVLLEAHNIRGQVNLNKSIGSGQFTAIAGTELRQIRTESHSLRAYGVDAETLNSSAVDFSTRYPNFLTGSSANILNNSSFSGGLNRFVSFFGNAAYTYKQTYTFTASGRRDASNLFGASTNNKWSPLWSAGIAWDLTREKFYHEKWGSTMKLRITYGCSGNADPSRSAVTTLTASYNNPYTQTTGALISQYKNPLLSWERVNMLNIGIDYSLPGNRVEATIEFYHKKGVNLFGNFPVDYTGLPTDNVVANVASISGNGWDIGINTINIKSPIVWSSELNLNLNNDRVKKNNLRTQLANTYAGVYGVGLPGQSVYALYGYKWAGLDPLTGDPQGISGGNVTKDYNLLTGDNATLADLEYIGSAMPTLTTSLGNTIKYKRFALSFRITGKFGYYFLRPSVDYGTMFKGGSNNIDYEKRWKSPGDEAFTSVPSLVYPAVAARDNFYRNSSVLFSKADNIRIQYITLSYELPKPSIQFYININNLGLLWVANEYGIDPDYNNSITPSRNIGIGLKINF